ncbi:SCO family protein [Pseudogracilibacillus sp. ICA-222130]|uniref:SCO family protein n=1 Tax=Pseudogracilibacillus sp. ICA-222130 TaxID=3134655 RepID=UPI0030BED4E7
MKKIYITFIALFVLGVGAGIYYLEIFRPGTAELPEDVVMETAFEETVNFNELPKRARLIEFMYTSCPDVCPVTTLEMAKLKSTLEEEGVFGDKVEFITITIDPEHDTTEVLRDYAGRFEVESDDDGWLFLTGSEEETRKIADALDFAYRDPGSGEIIHSTYTYFMDENDNLLEKFTMGEDFDRDRAYKRIMRTIN